MHIPMKLGPFALLMTIITICLTTLSILTWSTAGADSRLAQRYAETARIRYELEAQGQKFLRDADEALSVGEDPAGLEDVTEENGVIHKEFHEGGYSLIVGLRAEENSTTCEIVTWKLTKDWEQDQTIPDLWPGV